MKEPIEFDYRQISATDVLLMKDLLEVFGEAFGEVETYRHAQPGDAYLARLLEKTEIIALVALVGGAVVGGLVAYELEKFEQERREIYIYDLAVQDSHRRRGVATGLIRALQGIAAERGAYVIFVQADLEDAPAIALYDKLGTRESVLHFDVEVPGRK